MYLVVVLLLRRRSWCTTMVRGTKGIDLFSFKDKSQIETLFYEGQIIATP
jgi:hypothetical protein